MTSWHQNIFFSFSFRAQYSTSTTRNHYETLNLKSNCTAKEIRDAFVKLSKEVWLVVTIQQRIYMSVAGVTFKLNFSNRITLTQVKILSEMLPHFGPSWTRTKCLASLNRERFMTRWLWTRTVATMSTDFVFFTTEPLSNSSNFRRTPQPTHNDARYYGVFGSKRISNGKIVLYCMIFMCVGAVVQALAIR